MTKDDVIKREITHLLCIEPMAHSAIAKSLPKDVSAFFSWLPPSFGSSYDFAILQAEIFNMVGSVLKFLVTKAF